MRKARALSCLCVCSVFTFAGICGGEQADPCELDVLACQANLYDFALDPDCDLEGELTIEVGEGELGYLELEPDQLPEVHYGSQGGQHVFMGMRVSNAALDRYDKLLVRFGAYTECQIGEACYNSQQGDFLCSESSADPDSGVCEFTLGERTAVLGSAKTLRVVEDGVVEEYGLIVVLDSWPVWAGQGVLRVVVLDPCEQQGIAEHYFPSEPAAADTGASE